MQVLDRIAELGETMYKLEHRDNSGFFPAKTCRDLQLCHPIYSLEDGKNYLGVEMYCTVQRRDNCYCSPH